MAAHPSGCRARQRPYKCEQGVLRGAARLAMGVTHCKSRASWLARTLKQGGQGVGLSPPYCRDQLSLIAMRLLYILGSLSKPSGSASAFVSQAAAVQASLPPTPRIAVHCTGHSEPAASMES